MKASTHTANSKIIQIISILLLTFFVLAKPTHAQTIIYKKDGTRLEVKQVDNQGRVRSFKLLNDSTGLTHFISRTELDSIKYEDGRIERFISQIAVPGKDNNTDAKAQTFHKNGIGINIWPLLYSGIEIYYERVFLNDKLGFKNYLFINTSPDESQKLAFYHRANYYINCGLNYYYLRSEMFRFGTGISILTGQFAEERWEYYNNNQDVTYITENIQHTGLYVNASFGYAVLKNISTSIEFDFPIFTKLPYRQVLFKTEIAMKF